MFMQLNCSIEESWKLECRNLSSIMCVRKRKQERERESIFRKHPKLLKFVIARAESGRAEQG